MTTATLSQRQAGALSRRDFIIALAVILPLSAIIAPYRSVHLPEAFIAGVALLGGAWCLKIAVHDVEQLLFVLMLYVPFQKVLPGDFGGAFQAVNFLNGMLFLIAFGWVLRFLRRRSEPESYPQDQRGGGVSLVTITMTLWLASILFSIVWEVFRGTLDLDYAMAAELWRWLTPFVVFYLVLAVATLRETVKRLFLTVLITTAVIGLLGVKQFWMDMGGNRHDLESIRIVVTSGPSNLGAFFAYYLPYMVALLALNISTLAYWWLVFPIVWCMDSLRTTFSRGASLGFVMAVLLIVWSRSKVVFIFVVIAAAFIIQGEIMPMPTGVLGRMANTYSADRPGEGVVGKLDKSSQTRVAIWQGGLDMVREHPIVGVGYGQFRELIGNYRPSVARMDPHNSYLKLAAEQGLPVLAFFVLFLMTCFIYGWIVFRREQDLMIKAMCLGYCGSVAGLAMTNVFGSRLESAEITIQFWAMTACVVLVGRWQKREISAGGGANAAE